MERPSLIRRHLIARRDRLVARYHDAVERADAELDSRELEEAADVAEHWQDRVIGLLGDARVHELQAVLRAIGRIDDGSYGTCRVCGDLLDDELVAERPEAVCCVDCAVTVDLPALPPSSEPRYGRAACTRASHAAR